MRVLTLAGVLTLFSFASSAEGAPVDRDLVPDSATAIKVALPILEAYLGKARFDELIGESSLRAELEGEVWVVYTWSDDLGKIKTLPDGSTVVKVIAGGGVAIELSRHDAQVRDISLSK